MILIAMLSALAGVLVALGFLALAYIDLRRGLEASRANNARLAALNTKLQEVNSNAAI